MIMGNIKLSLIKVSTVPMVLFFFLRIVVKRTGGIPNASLE